MITKYKKLNEPKTRAKMLIIPLVLILVFGITFQLSQNIFSWVLIWISFLSYIINILILIIYDTKKSDEEFKKIYGDN